MNGLKGLKVVARIPATVNTSSNIAMTLDLPRKCTLEPAPSAVSLSKRPSRFLQVQTGSPSAPVTWSRDTGFPVIPGCQRLGAVR